MRYRHAALAAIALAGAILVCGIQKHPPFTEDSAVYIDLAHSLSEGKGLVTTSGSQERTSNYYPFVYPALLAPMVTLFPGDYAAYKLFSVVLFLLLCAVLFRDERMYFRSWGWFIVLCVVFNAQLGVYGRSVLSELPYILFSLLALRYCLRFAGERALFSPQLAMAWVFVFLSSYTRLIGLTLIPAVLLYFLIRKDWRRFFVSLSFLAVALPWFWQNVLCRSTYLLEFGARTAGVRELAARWAYNAGATVGKELPDLFFYPWFAGIDPYDKVFLFKALGGCCLAALCLFGLVKKIREEGAGLAETYSVVYAVVAFSWTHHGARYLLPLLPFLIYYMFIALKTLAGSRVTVAAVCVLVLANVAGSINLAWKEHRRPFEPAEVSLMEAADWLRDNAGPGAVVVSRKPNWMYLYSGVKGEKFLSTKDTARQLVHLTHHKAAYFVIDRNKIYRDDSRDYLVPLAQDYPERFERVFATRAEPKTLIYRVRDLP